MFKPMYDRVLVKRQAAAETIGGLFVPTGAREKNPHATVVAVGEGRINQDGSLTPLKVEVGMTVVLPKWDGDVVEIEGEEHILVRESDILGIFF